MEVMFKLIIDSDFVQDTDALAHVQNVLRNGSITRGGKVKYHLEMIKPDEIPDDMPVGPGPVICHEIGA